MRGRKVTYGLLALAVVLLLGSTLGSTRAALTYYSDNYVAEITVSQIGVTLLENDEKVISRDYNDSQWNESTNREGRRRGWRRAASKTCFPRARSWL